jgi:hypothetical protein
MVQASVEETSLESYSQQGFPVLDEGRFKVIITTTHVHSIGGGGRIFYSFSHQRNGKTNQKLYVRQTGSGIVIVISPL